jgi:hypothetical protein
MALLNFSFAAALHRATGLYANSPRPSYLLAVGYRCHPLRGFRYWINFLIEGNKIELWEANDIVYKRMGQELGSETTK